MIFLGVPKQEVMESAPSDLWCYEDAFKLRRKHIDEVSYAMGIYTYEAVGIAVGNAFRGKGQRPTEYLKQPLLSEYDQSEADKQRKRELFVAQLMAMKANFDIHKKEGVS